MDELPCPVIVTSVALTSIVRRLEAATSRLEDMASSVIEVPKTNGSVPAVTAPAAAGPPMATSKPPAPKAVAEPIPQMIEDFDTLIATTVKKYLDISKEIGGPVEEQVHMLFKSPLSQS
jgi:adenylyl cyclase-associated protein